MVQKRRKEHQIFSKFRKKSQNFDRKRISEIKNEQGNIVSDQTGILGVLNLYFEKFYQNVTSSNAMQIDAYLEEVNLRPLSSYQTESISGPVTKQEYLTALLKMSNNKSPGLGGFSVEFYKCFWNDINDLLLQSNQVSYDAGVLTNTQREGIIILIPKRNKNPLLPSSYRLITLLNIDYKITASVINSRMKCYLNELIRPGQNAFIKGRHIGDNIRLLFYVIDLIAANEIPGSIFTANICKAFDSLNWDFMLRVVEKYCFGSIVLKWIKTFYTMPVCKIASGNLLSEKFSIGRGVRQGDPLSPTLFILCIECLANILRDSHLFNGLKIGDLSVKVSMFADDTLIFLNGLENQFEYVFDIFQTFGRISGCRLNLDKFEAFHIGSNILRNDHPMAHFGLKWPQYTINYLGVTIPINHPKTNLNYFD